MSPWYSATLLLARPMPAATSASTSPLAASLTTAPYPAGPGLPRDPPSASTTTRRPTPLEPGLGGADKDAAALVAAEHLVRLPGGEAEVNAAMALGYAYEPAIGDMLLIIGDDEGGRWVIGVIEGRGKTDMRFEGDVHLHAARGALTLSADNGVRVRGPELDVVVERFAVAAGSAVQKCATLYQRVRELMTVHARESHAIVEETALQRAKKVAVVAEETASVNGKQILLG